jgi:hypothetical protein
MSTIKGDIYKSLFHFPENDCSSRNPTSSYYFQMWDGDEVKIVPYNISGIDYYVNNITGNDNNDGLSRDTAVAEINRAIILSEAARLASWGGVTLTNHTLKNRIHVQGTGISYAAITSPPSFCDIIAEGATPYGDGSGIVVVSGKSTTSPTPAIAGTARGLGLYGIQFETSGDCYVLDFVNLFRSEIYFCGIKASDPTLVTVATTGGVRFTGNSGGNYIHENMWMGGNDSWFTYGITTGSDVVIFNENRIENNFIEAATAGMYVAAETVTGDNTHVVRNHFTGGNHTLAVSVDDNSTVGRILYCGNYCGSTDGGQLFNNGAIRWVGNYRANGFSTVTAS